jgi:hypothetical protein
LKHHKAAGAAVWKVRRTRLLMRPAVCGRMFFLVRIRKNAVDSVMRKSAAEKRNDDECHYFWK